MKKHTRTFDLVVYGVTGFTGRLVAQYLLTRSESVKSLRWAIAGRSPEKLDQLRTELGATDIPVIVADASEPETLEAMAAATQVVLTTVGPYQLYGEPLVAACVKTGTDYVDLTGEPNWIRSMVDGYHHAAQASGARILNSCGLDSIPSELGVWHLQQLAQQKFGKPMPRVRGRVVEFSGGPSGGSLASGREAARAARDDPEFLALLSDPFALTPGFTGPEQPSSEEVKVEPDIGPVMPFLVLGATDAKIVRRSNMLLDFAYGEDFVYDELMLGKPEDLPPPLPVDQWPEPGEGPKTDNWQNGRFEIMFIGSDDDGNEIRSRLKCEMDPGYLGTARMVTETALALLENSSLPGGLWTPAAALNQALLERLEAHAAMQFTAE
jgi:short subunit dehydrogenase-like uncharacterized protein